MSIKVIYETRPNVKGQRVEELVHGNIPMTGILRIEATGDGLEKIRNRFRGLRDRPHADPVNFVGDDAMFIVANW